MCELEILRICAPELIVSLVYSVFSWLNFSTSSSEYDLAMFYEPVIIIVLRETLLTASILKERRRKAVPTNASLSSSAHRRWRTYRLRLQDYNDVGREQESVQS